MLLWGLRSIRRKVLAFFVDVRFHERDGLRAVRLIIRPPLQGEETIGCTGKGNIALSQSAIPFISERSPKRSLDVAPF